MFRKPIAAGLLSLAMFAAGAPAHAGEVSISIGISQSGQGYAPGLKYVDHRGWMSTATLCRRARSAGSCRRHGFSHIEFVDTEGRTYTARAEDHRGPVRPRARQRPQRRSDQRQPPGPRAGPSR
jgi:hypothetical protein